MYKKMYINHSVTNEPVEHIFKINANGSQTGFPNVESNDGPERKTYLAWVAEGNVAEEWNPNGN
jgi:hypothetical protein